MAVKKQESCTGSTDRRSKDRSSAGGRHRGTGHRGDPAVQGQPPLQRAGVRGRERRDLPCAARRTRGGAEGCSRGAAAQRGDGERRHGEDHGSGGSGGAAGAEGVTPSVSPSA